EPLARAECPRGCRARRRGGFRRPAPDSRTAGSRGNRHRNRGRALPAVAACHNEPRRWMTMSNVKPAHSLRAENLALAYDGRQVISGLDLEIPDGGITVIVGANACGKSTLLRGI